MTSPSDVMMFCVPGLGYRLAVFSCGVMMFCAVLRLLLSLGSPFSALRLSLFTVTDTL